MLSYDAAISQKSAVVRKFCNKIDTTLRALEENTPWSNKAELYIGIIKEEATRKETKSSDFLLAFRDYCLQCRARLNNLTAEEIFSLHGSNTHTSLTGKEGNISDLCQYN